MKNHIQNGEHLTVTAPADLASGDGVLIGEIFGVAQSAAASGDQVVIVRKGVYQLPKTSAQAWTDGARIYWDGAECTTSSSGNKLIGAAAAAAANPSDTGLVLLDGAIR